MRLFADVIVVDDAEGLVADVRESLVPLVSLSFDYGGVRVRASDDRSRMFRSSAEGLESLDRRAADEAEARRVLERLGAVELSCLDAVAPPDGCDADYVLRVDGDTHAFCALTARAIECWRALGWNVEVAPGYPFCVVDAETTWYAEVKPCGERDWFALEMGIEVDGVRIDLVPLLVDMLKQLDLEGGLERLAARSSWALPVSETHYVTVPRERLRALLRVVAELYQGDRRRGASFPEARASALLTLERELSGGGRGRWVDRAGAACRARERAAALRPASAPAGLRASLRPYQADGVAFLQRVRAAGSGGLLADEMGLGKTLQTIAHVCLEHEQGRLDAPALVVAPTSLVDDWAREIARFAPHLRVVVLHGPQRQAAWSRLPQAHIVVTTYAVLVRDEERFATTRFHLVVLDEAQAIKNVRSLARRALQRIPSDHRLCLTGTPVENHLGELWSIFDWLSPGLLGDELAFRRFWRQPIEQRRDAERLAALRDLVAPYVLRRLKKDVARELPPKTEVAIPLTIEGAQRELYEAIRAAAHEDVRRAIRAKGLAGSAIAILGALTKLRQVCCHPRLLAMDAARGVRQSAKLEALLELVDGRLAAGHRLLVFSQFASMLAIIGEALAARGVGYLALTGATPCRDRQRIVDAFEKGRADVFLVSLKAGGTGLNLTAADSVVHYDPWWNPAARAQATDRAYRIGQARPVFVHDLYVAGSVEERVIELQRSKRWLSSAVLGDPASGGALTEHEVEALFAPLES